MYNLIIAACATGLIWAFVHCVIEIKSFKKSVPRPRLSKEADYFLTRDTPKVFHRRV